MDTLKTKSTSDMGLAAAFFALGATLASVDKTDPRHMQFTFSPRQITTGELASVGIPTQDLDSIELLWANKSLPVNAVEFYDAIKRLKGIVHSK
jgi:hypothetical protein